MMGNILPFGLGLVLNFLAPKTNFNQVFERFKLSWICQSTRLKFSFSRLKVLL